MLYYHGSPNLFGDFDLSFSRKGMYPVIHLTPHKEYARHFALKDEGSDGWIYTIEIEGQEDIEYHEGAQNCSIGDASILKIIDVEKVKR